MKKLYDGINHVISLNQTAVGAINPVGITLHYSASGSIESCVNALKEKKLGYHLIIDQNGDVYQFAEFDKKLNHAGNAVWMGLSPNSNHIAVCFINWGILSKKDGKFFTWTKKEIDKNDVRERDGVFWHKATEHQEEALTKFLNWAVVDQGINPKHICGHDESAIPFGRKADPGGILVNRMKDLRSFLSDKK